MGDQRIVGVGIIGAGFARTTQIPAFKACCRWMKAGVDGAAKVALTRSRKIYNRRAYDNVHYVPVLAA